MPRDSSQASVNGPHVVNMPAVIGAGGGRAWVKTGGETERREAEQRLRAHAGRQAADRRESSVPCGMQHGTDIGCPLWGHVTRKPG